MSSLSSSLVPSDAYNAPSTLRDHFSPGKLLSSLPKSRPAKCVHAEAYRVGDDWENEDHAMESRLGTRTIYRTHLKAIVFALCQMALAVQD